MLYQILAKTTNLKYQLLPETKSLGILIKHEIVTDNPSIRM